MPRRSSRTSAPAPSRTAPSSRRMPTSTPARMPTSTPARTASSVPTRSQPQHTAPTTAPSPATSVGQPKQPGMLSQMAATAGSVAVGSAVGHVVGNAMTGMFGGSSSTEHPQEQQQVQNAYNEQPSASQDQNNPCAYELQKFLDCAQNYPNDLSLCQAFNEQLKQCKASYGTL